MWLSVVVVCASARMLLLLECAPRSSGVGPLPNKPMHPTADTIVVMYNQRPCAAGDWQRYAASPCAVKYLHE
jgi:hypothetical protein